MIYAIIGEDKENSLELRLENRPAHLEQIKKLQDNGKLVLAGPFPIINSESTGDSGFSGSLIVAEFANIDEAQQWADNDPYSTAGVYNQVTVKPFIKVMP